MFRNQAGNLCTNAEATAEKIKGASDEEVEVMEERQGVMRDALNSFDIRLQDFPERKRNAAFSLLYKEIVKIIFDFQFSFEASETHAKFENAMTHEEKENTLREFQARIQDLKRLYGIE